jgi:predicted transcriptional regulator
MTAEAVYRYLMRSPHGRTLSEIAHAVGVTRSSAWRNLRSLLKSGQVDISKRLVWDFVPVYKMKRREQQ